MPTIPGIPGPFRLYFYSFDCNEPVHVHVQRSTAAKTGSDPRVQSLEVSDDSITAHLADGRTISVPLAWSWRLTNATPEQRRNYEIIGDGQGIRWPDVDEDISVQGMLEGIPAHRPRPM